MTLTFEHNVFYCVHKIRTQLLAITSSTSNNPYQGRTVVSPYVGMARKQDGGSNECISNYTTITRLEVDFTRFKAPSCRIRTLPWPTRTPTSSEGIAKVANRQAGKT